MKLFGVNDYIINVKMRWFQVLSRDEIIVEVIRR